MSAHHLATGPGLIHCSSVLIWACPRCQPGTIDLPIVRAPYRVRSMLRSWSVLLVRAGSGSESLSDLSGLILNIKETDGGLRPVFCLSEGGGISLYFTPWFFRQELLSLLHIIVVLWIQLCSVPHSYPEVTLPAPQCTGIWRCSFKWVIRDSYTRP